MWGGAWAGERTWDVTLTCALSWMNFPRKLRQGVTGGGGGSLPHPHCHAPSRSKATSQSGVRSKAAAAPVLG